MKNIALILLGGSGKRFGGETPKQFIKKNNIPIYIDAIIKYQNVDSISDILLVVNKDYIDEVKRDLKTYNIKKVIDVIPGGKKDSFLATLVLNISLIYTIKMIMF